MKKVAFYTLGCKVNQYETEAMLEMFKKDGYVQVESEDYADVYVINTCTVTHMSDRKSRQYIRRMKKKNPDAIIAVVGCYSQVSPEEILEIEEVNLVMGTNERRQIVEEIKKLDASQKASTVDDIMKVRAFEEIEINQTNGKTRAFMKIQDGCDRFCSYCIIPYARGGKVRSRDLESIVNEANKLADKGYKEIVLTGIHVASYGKDVTDANMNLLTVIKAIDEIENIERIRLSSVEPVLFTEEFVEEVSKMDKVCPHYHLSLQSGCDETLKRMNRRYTTKEYKEIVDRLRAHIPDVAITTDIIVGFPGETNAEFSVTNKFLEEIELSQMHVFKYSPRKGTPAATMENQIDPQMKQLRSDKLIALGHTNFKKFASKYEGKEVEVLFEHRMKDNKFEGLTTNYIRVIVDSEKDIQGQILKVKITKVNDEFVEGILV
ncbi:MULTISPECIES: tRNA (N(6)-L-threonylcarbamoyladenosine(37)-C(2))-methylthiotransferase MtaB [Romboutsia]|uniref:Threonylcarbamoyladenosine tRNA methylthiotransferase MtaB n=1 Tax=Romboutsia hominis TaxID=1507512 RepID=A0A2P2BP85_9FIRM|nr:MULTISPECIES: tRNA (N(6)-L-threonylcarbamoyladenosine(37)-C(2))-methylthiotransferase MtaB [Romboutsia]MCH1959187.1 tRNA (N(6)-L-threonylcarbamoyladenosine(37)-C(2))-methylthiotransferase MtaB [Romboutsia hominis]MCH1970087.1 tRNA (N(6)-L-threonylcarbamoyladenosine(37)-C(2))-methylthiotransferase MtaB [Romboutsia hominis]MDB8790302.1 tRNA (N(6)-L-threonylcarbamoyladenosine(37)-C(2))-methylthiotransferase MtaB [Romboutsia sp. 1001216sp1]MDB8792264.1 tRNA (N(6)-L-threonylcarbamoyladenosine(37)